MSDIEKLNSVKFNIRKALESQGSDITVDTPFEEYSKYIMELNSGGVEPTGTITITENGTVDVSEYAQADVNVPASAVVSGTKTIISNGTYDVTTFASAEVNVPSSSPSHGTLHIINNTSGTLYFPKYQFINGAFVYQSTAPVMVSAHGSKDMIIPTDGAGGILIDIMVKSASSSKDITGVLISTQDGTINRLYNLTSSMCLDSANNNTRVYFTLDVRNSTSATITFANPT